MSPARRITEFSKTSSTKAGKPEKKAGRPSSAKTEATNTTSKTGDKVNQDDGGSVDDKIGPSTKTDETSEAGGRAELSKIDSVSSAKATDGAHIKTAEDSENNVKNSASRQTSASADDQKQQTALETKADGQLVTDGSGQTMTAAGINDTNVMSLNDSLAVDGDAAKANLAKTGSAFPRTIPGPAIVDTVSLIRLVCYI